jgi:hypothetical protein
MSDNGRDSIEEKVGDVILFAVGGASVIIFCVVVGYVMRCCCDGCSYFKCQHNLDDDPTLVPSPPLPGDDVASRRAHSSRRAPREGYQSHTDAETDDEQCEWANNRLPFLPPYSCVSAPGYFSLESTERGRRCRLDNGGVERCQILVMQSLPSYNSLPDRGNGSATPPPEYKYECEGTGEMADLPNPPPYEEVNTSETNSSTTRISSAA